MGCLATLDPIRPLGTCRDPPGGQGWVWGQWGHSWPLGLMTQPCALSLPISRKVQGGGWETECPVHRVTAWWRVGACLNADPETTYFQLHTTSLGVHHTRAWTWAHTPALQAGRPRCLRRDPCPRNQPQQGASLADG